MRALQADIDATALVDLTGIAQSDPLYHPDDYAVSQRFGENVREANRSGMLFTSVRRPRYPCMALYQPSMIRRCEPVGIYVYRWDGKQITMEQRTKIIW